ncbi:hypothetical protein [Stigmatella aurantiaca]|uniref:Uncharacterized protein n=1 Tax=Stigmatella aurantiaca (strain DW4/3-1) TaxID=378806 RepID=Q09D76_STIAD|nr:hypothetical protein [Stigmatella aurantiaca]ADO67830.1 uncharacterized protein STAUR_0021 [Stigmatella aurantiaca DW4/3-1]EAU69598.1 hypothetical protein STIAU_2981 [Stigmatella aurantiaca DW4/3-1]
MGLVANSRRDPGAVAWGSAELLVKRRELPQVVAVDFVRRSDGAVGATVAGSTDLVCEPPHLMVLNIDEDDEPEVYFTTCDESGFVDYRGAGQLVAVELSEQEAAQLRATDSFWFREVQSGGWHLLSVGTRCIVLGFAGLGATVLFSRRTRK